ncbi:hypothetical protein AAMO2058_000540600 [Amorphochlora amoebiformis]
MGSVLLPHCYPIEKKKDTDPKGKIILHLTCLDGKTYRMNYSPSLTRGKILAKLEEFTGRDADMIRIIWAGKQQWRSMEETVDVFRKREFANPEGVFKVSDNGEKSTTMHVVFRYK